MVLRNSQLTILAGMFAAVAVCPIACSSEFEGCKASRTCKPESQGGEGGEDENTGGTSGRAGDASGGSAPGGSSGYGGMAGAGDGGSGGSGDDTERPTIVSLAPGDGDVDIERDVTIAVELSEAIDEGSVTSTSVTLTGPSGDVAGTLAVDGNVITFAPERALHLLGTYTFTVDDTIADLAGNTLEEASSVEFRVRDGRWSEPEFPFGAMVRETPAFGRNALGDVVVGMNAPTSPVTVFGSTYRAGDRKWTRAAELATPTGAQFRATSAGIDDFGRAAVSFRGGKNGLSRLTEDGNWVDVRDFPGPSSVYVSPAGQALAAWWEADTAHLTQILDLSDGTLSSARPSPLTFDEAAGETFAWSLEREALFTSWDLDVDETDVTVAWRGASDWLPYDGVATGIVNSFLVDTDERGNIMVVWANDDEIWSRLYHRDRDEWLPASFVASEPSPAYVPLPRSLDATAGGAILSFSVGGGEAGTWAAVYEPGVGWVASSIVKLDSEPTNAAVALDSTGNGVVAWHPQGKVRRYVSDSGWEPESRLGITTYGGLWAAAAADGSVLVVSTEAQGLTIGAPYSVRFE